MLNSEQDTNETFKFLNSQHSNIKFTYEKRKDDKLALLDFLISKTDQNFCTSVYHKKTSKGLYTDFVSFTPYSYKIGLIKTLIHRIYEIGSSWTSFNEEISNVKPLLIKNMYPSYLIDKQIKSSLNNKFSTSTCNAVKESKTTLYYKLPYTDPFSNNTNKKVKELCKKFCKNYSISIVFFTNIRLFTRWSGILYCIQFFFVQDVNPVILVKLNVIYLQWLMNIW